jgi:hypothetical protein
MGIKAEELHLCEIMMATFDEYSIGVHLSAQDFHLNTGILFQKKEVSKRLHEKE